MTQQLRAQLSKMTDVDFHLLEHYLYLARLVRDVMTRCVLDDKQMADILQVPITEMKSIKNGAYDFDLMFVSRLQAYNNKMAAEDAKAKAEIMKFPKYEYQVPLSINKTEYNVYDVNYQINGKSFPFN